MKKPLIAALAGIVVVSSVGTGAAAAAMDKEITLSVDGQEQQVRVWGATVQDALDAHDLELTERDEVVPAADQRISEGSSVSVSFARPVTALVDGEERTIWTTATTLADALDEIGLHDPASRLSVDRSTPLGREGLTFAASTPKGVEVLLGGVSHPTRSTAADVASLLAESGIVVDGDDRVTPSLDTPVTEGLVVDVQRVEVLDVREWQPIEHQSVKTDDDTLAKGTEKVTQEGSNGEKIITWTITYVEGLEESRIWLGEEVAIAPVDELVSVGTKVGAVPAAGGGTTYAGSHSDWMSAAGINPADWSAVEILINRESTWNPNAVNPSSGACGLVQALPCSKLGPNWNDPVVALQWGDNYVKQRYGGWQQALAHSYAVGWY